MVGVKVGKMIIGVEGLERLRRILRGSFSSYFL